MEKIKNKSNVYIHIFTGEIDEGYCDPNLLFRKFIEAQDHCYRQFLLKRNDACFKDENYKTFGSAEELFDHINEDLCHH